MRRKFFKGWKRSFHLQRWYILHFFNLLWRLIFGLKTQKTPLDHVLDSKMQTTRRVGALVTLFERYDPNKAFQKTCWVPVTWEKFFRDQQSQRSNLPKLSFWTDFDWTGLILGSKREFWKIASLTLLVSKKFFSSHWNSKFFREAFVRIISFKQSNWHAHTTCSLHFRIQNVI